MQYRYIEFTDKTAKKPTIRKNGTIWYVGEPSAELIKELELEEVTVNGKVLGYTSNLASLGGKGWELQFVTTCGVNFNKFDNLCGPIENSYIFKKSGD